MTAPAFAGVQGDADTVKALYKALNLNLAMASLNANDFARAEEAVCDWLPSACFGAAAARAVHLHGTLTLALACCLRHQASFALTVDSGEVKALFRRGTARMHMGNNDGALKDLHAAAKAAPKNKYVGRQLQLVCDSGLTNTLFLLHPPRAVRKAFKQCKAKVQAEKARLKKAYGGFLGKVRRAAGCNISCEHSPQC